jgi:methyl-accepting chemotaxis protein
LIASLLGLVAIVAFMVGRSGLGLALGALFVLASIGMIVRGYLVEKRNREGLEKVRLAGAAIESGTGGVVLDLDDYGERLAEIGRIVNAVAARLETVTDEAAAAQAEARKNQAVVEENAMDLAISLSAHLGVLQKIAEGDLTVRETAMSSEDLLRTLTTVSNQMIDALRELIGATRQAGLNVGTLSAEVTTAFEQIAQGTKSYITQLNDSTAAVTELSASIQEVSTNAAASRETARKAAALAQGGGDAVTRNIGEMEKIKTTVGRTSGLIVQLGESGKRIGKIVEVITNIAEQTSLLALNAAIEAARAGEHGKGFAVVADEVSKLADRSAKSAKEIEELIEEITDQTDDAVSSMQAVAEEVEVGMGLTRTTGETLHEVIGSIEEAAHAVSEISTAVAEQAKASDDISSTMERISQITRESVAATEQALKHANEMMGVSASL